MPARARGPLSLIDPSWLFLGAGLALVASAALIPAFEDLRQARFHRDRAAAMERFRLERLATYSAYLDAIERGDETLMRSLASTQLNLVPVGTHVALTPVRTGEDADVFRDLDPEYIAPIEPMPIGSTLERWSLDPSARLWLLAFGCFFTLVGVLPAAPRRR